MISTEKKVVVANELKTIVNNFNSSFSAWLDEHDCVAEFSWSYNHAGQKQIEIVSIDSIVYRRKPNADFTTIKEAMKKEV